MLEPQPDPRKDDKPEACDCCEYETTEIKYYSPPFGQIEGDWLCEVCASTYLNTSIQYDHNFGLLAKSLGWIANRILEEIRNGKA